MLENRIPITRVRIGDEERRRVAGVLESGWLVQGPQVAAFEERVASVASTAHAVAVTSCSTALQLAMLSLGLKPGDEVIVPAFTWVSTASAVAHCGATPVFCDVDPATFNLVPGFLGSLVTSRTVGVVPVHLFGRCVDMDAVGAVAERHGLWVLEDAACALGSTWKGSAAGSMGSAGCFSFHPRKSVTTGEGGVVTTSIADLASVCRALRNHGAVVDALDRDSSACGALLPGFPVLGFNARMTDLQAAVGVGQMGQLDALLDERGRLAGLYDAALAGLDWLVTPTRDAGSRHTFQSYVCLVGPGALSFDGVVAAERLRDALMAELESVGISTRQGTHAPPFLACYAEPGGWTARDFPGAAVSQGQSLALPLFPGLGEDGVARVRDALIAAWARVRVPGGSP